MLKNPESQKPQNYNSQGGGGDIKLVKKLNFEESELAIQYSNNNFHLKMHNFSALAFFPADKIIGVLNELKPHLLEDVNKVTDWFENNFVHFGVGGGGRRKSHNCLLFPHQCCFC